jgi:hypothetical protein
MELREGLETNSRKHSRDFHALGSYQVATPTSIDLRCCQFVSRAAQYIHLIAKGARNQQAAGNWQQAANLIIGKVFFCQLQAVRCTL